MLLDMQKWPLCYLFIDGYKCPKSISNSLREKEEEVYFAFSIVTLFILPIYFTTHHIFQFFHTQFNKIV